MIQRIERSFHLEEWRADELETSDQELLNPHNALPSSLFPVFEVQCGLCGRLASGAIVAGGNPENAAYPSGLCAERIAFFNGARSDDPIVTAAVVPITPCLCLISRRVAVVVSDAGDGDRGHAHPIFDAAGESICCSTDVAQFLPLSFRLPAHRNP